MTERTVKVTLDLVTTAYIAGAKKAEQGTASLGREVESTEHKVGGLSRAVEKLRADLTALPSRQNVRVDVDIRGLQQARTKLERLGQGLKTEVGLDTSKWEREAKRAARALRVSVRAHLDMSNVRPGAVDVRARLDTSRWQDEASRAARRLRVEVNSRLKVRVEGQLRERDLQRQLNAMHLRVRIRPDLGNPGSGGSIGASLGAGLNAGFLGATLKVGALVSLLPQAVAGVSAITAATVALGGSLTSVLGLAGALPAALAAGGAVVGSIGLSLFGVVDAVKKLNEEQDQAGAVGTRLAAQAQASSERQRNAANGVVNARRGIVQASRGVEDAERSLSRARETAGRSQEAVMRAQQDAERTLTRAQDASRRSQEAVTRAQQDAIAVQEELTDARKSAAERLQDLSFRQTANALAEERAALSLQQARQALAEARQSGVGVQNADLNVREAVQALEELRVQRARDSEEAALAARKGVEGSDLVAAAQGRVADAAGNVADAQRDAAESAQGVADAQRDAVDSVAAAQRAARDAADGVADAQRGVVSAQESVTVAQQGLTEALRDQTAAIEDIGSPAAASIRNVENAMAELSPVQQQFARYLYSLKGDFADLRASAAQGLLPGLQEDIERTRVLLPTLQTALQRTGSTLTNLDNGKRRFTDPAGMERIAALLESADGLTGDLGRSGILLADAFLRVGVEAAPMVSRLGEAAERSSELVLAYVTAKSESGELAESFDRVYDRSAVLMGAFGNVRGALAGTFTVGMDSGDDMLVSIERLAERWEAWVDSIEGQNALREWFDEGRETMTELGGLVGDIKREFAGLTDEADFSDFVGQVREAVPYVAALVKSLSGQGETGRQLADGLLAVLEALDRLDAGGAIGNVVQALAALVTVTADLISSVPGGAAALGVLLTAYAGFKVLASITGMVTGFTTSVALLPAALGPVGGVLAVVAAGLLTLQSYRGTAQGIAEDIRAMDSALVSGSSVTELTKQNLELQKAVQDRLDLVKEYDERGAFGRFIRPLTGVKVLAVKRDMDDMVRSAEEASDAVLGFQNNLVDYQAALIASLAENPGTIEEMVDGIRLSTASIAELQQVAEAAGVKVGDSNRRTTDTINAYAYAQSEAGIAAKQHAEDLGVLSDKSSTASEKTAALRREMELLDGGTTDANAALIQFEAGLDAISVAAEQSGKSLDISTDAGRKNQQAIIDAKKALDDRIASMVAADATEEEVRQAVISGSDALRARITDTYGVTEETKKLLEQYRLTPDDITTTVRMLGAEDATEKLRLLKEQASELMKVPGMTQVEAISLIKQEQAQANRQRKATGGPVYGSGTATSDSIPVLMSNDEHVITAAEVKAFGGHGAVERLRAMVMQGFANGGAVLQKVSGTIPLHVNSGAIGDKFGALVAQLSEAMSAGERRGQPSSSTGLIPIMKNARQYVMDTYGISNIGGFARRNIAGTGKLSDHALGKAIDVMTNNRALGNRVAADFAFGPASKRFRSENVIWQQAISSNGKPFRGMADRGSATQNHRDHVHIDTYARGGRVIRAGSNRNPVSGGYRGRTIAPSLGRGPVGYQGRTVSPMSRPRLGPPALPTSGDATLLAELQYLDRRIAAEKQFTAVWLDLYAQRNRVMADYVSSLDRIAVAAEQAADGEIGTLNQLLDSEQAIRDRMAESQDRHLEGEQSARTRMRESQDRYLDARLDREESYLADRQRLIDDRARSLGTADPYAGFSESGFSSDLSFLTRNLSRQSADLEAYFRELAEARARGLSEGAITSLGLDQGPQSLRQLRRVNAASLDQVQAFNDQVAGLAQQSQRQASTEAAQGVGALGRQLTDLRGTYLSDLDQMTAAFTADQAAMNAEMLQMTVQFTADQAALSLELSQVGTDQGRSFGQAIADGLASSIPAIVEQARAARAALTGATGARGEATAGQTSQSAGLEQQVRDAFRANGVKIATNSESEQERIARIVASISSGSRTLEQLTASLVQMGPLASQIRAAFASAGVTISNDGENEQSRIARIVDEMTNGGRTLAQLNTSLAAQSPLSTTRRIALSPNGGRERLSPVNNITVKIGETELRQISRQEFTTAAVTRKISAGLAGVMP